MSTDTRCEAYKRTRESGRDVALRKKVCATLAHEPATVAELTDRFPQHTANALRPRVNELVRMGCLERDGKRKNPSGHQAYVHRVTDTGMAYLAGEVDPDPAPTLSELKSRVVRVARAVAKGEADRDVLEIAIERYDHAVLTRDPEAADADV